MSHLKILQSYAQRAPESLPASILFSHTEKNITIFDAFPKSIFHFLVLPRVLESGLNHLDTLGSLYSLLKADKNDAKAVVASLAQDAQIMKGEIEKEMVKHYGFKWDVWMGFHAVPSMVHLHLHVLSADLCSDKLKHKKHYNSFHPKMGYFLHLDDVLSWLDAEPTFYDSMVKELSMKSHYEAKLKEPLACFHCYKEMKNMPALKTHLQEEWDTRRDAAKVSQKRKRNFEQHLKKKIIEVDDLAYERDAKRARSELHESVEE